MVREAEETRQAEEARLAEEARVAEEARLAEEARVAEEARLAEEARALYWPLAFVEVFDRGGFKYHGVIRAIADGAREAGLKF